MSEQHEKDENTRAAQGAVSRRAFMQGVITASAAAGTVGLPTSAAAVSPTTPGTTLTKILTEDQSRALPTVLNLLIPAEGALPGAGALGVAAFIEKALAAGPHLRRHIVGVMSALPDSVTLGTLTAEQVEGLLRRIEQAMPESFDILLQATYTGYYSHPQVVAALGVQSDGGGAPLAGPLRSEGLGGAAGGTGRRQPKLVHRRCGQNRAGLRPGRCRRSLSRRSASVVPLAAVVARHPAVRQEFAHLAQRRERRAELVRDGCDEARLELRDFEFPRNGPRGEVATQ